MKSIQHLLATVALAALLTLAGCFSQTGLPLEIVTITPALNASDVLINSTITIAASAEIDATTATADSIRLLKGSPTAGTEVATGVTVSAESITITPTAALDFGTQYTVVIAGTVADTDGNLLSGEVSWGFTTRPLLVSVTTTGGQLVAGARITVAGSYVGTTNGVGQLPVTWSSGGTAAVAATKKFFLPTSDPAIPLDGSSYDAQLEVSPYIFVPDFSGTVAAIPKIIRLTDVGDDPATAVQLTSIDHSGSALNPYILSGPRWIEVDYQNGAIYVADAALDDDPTTIIKMTDFPPAADGSEATAVTSSGVNEVYGTQQFTVMSDGRVILPYYESFLPYESRVIELPANLDFSAAATGPVFASNYFYGIDRLPSGELLVIESSAFSVSLFELDDYADGTKTNFVTDAAITYGTGTNEFYIPTRAIVAPAGDYVYVSDTGELGNSLNYNNSRIVRYAIDGTGFTPYGTRGTGTDQFFNPVLLGLLPDNKLYIMDVNNDRLIRIDPGVFDGGPADWTESDVTANFSFAYWYNFS